MKKVISSLLAVIFVLCTVNVAVFADEASAGIVFSCDFTGSNLTPSVGTVSTGGTASDSGLLLSGFTTSDNEYYTIYPETGNVTIEMTGLEKNSNIDINVDYVDEDWGFFFLKYIDRNGKIKTTKEIPVYGVNSNGETVSGPDNGSVTFRIQDALIEDDGTCEISLLNTSMSSGVYTSAQVSYFISKNGVTIEKIEASSDGTISPVSVDIESGMIGNIFFDATNPSFNMTYTNDTDAAVDFTANYTVYEINTDMERGSIIASGSENVSVESYASAADEFSFAISKYGLYELDIEITNTSSSIYQKYSVPFSNAVKSTELSDTVGVNTHLDVNGDPESIVRLMKNAGIGHMRDGISWSSYEKAQGVYGLSDKDRRKLEAAQRYGIEVLSQISVEFNKYQSNGSQFLNEDDVEAYRNYLYEFLNDDLVKATVKRLEIMNEPDIKKKVCGEVVEGTDAQAHEKRATAYARQVKATRDVLDTIGEHNYSMGILSVTGIRYTSAKRFADLVLSKLDNGDFDTLTLHPYLAVSEDPEKGVYGTDSNNASSSLVYQVDYFKHLASGEPLTDWVDGSSSTVTGNTTGNTYSFDISQPIWHTEFGYNSSIPYENTTGVSVGDDYKQAVMMIRALNQIKIGGINDTAYIYEMSSRGDRRTNQEFNFELVRSSASQNPYSARFGYLAASNYNSLTANAASATEEVADLDSYSFVTKYDVGNKNTYMLWSTKDSGSTVSYDFTEDEKYDGNVTYFDLFGNEINENEIKSGNTYNLTTTPFYAVVGEDVVREEQSASTKPGISTDGKVVIEGRLASGREGVPVSLIVTDSSADFSDSDLISSALHVNQAITANGGQYSFTVDIKTAESVKAFVVGAGERIEFNFTLNPNEETGLSLLSGGVSADTLEFGELDFNNLTARVNFGKYQEAVDYELFCAVYSGDLLLDVQVSDGSYYVGNDFSVDEQITFKPVAEQGNKIKIMMLYADNTLRPVCEAYVLD